MQLDELFEQVTQTKSSGRYSQLSKLADLCLMKDVRLPSGLRLALQAISGDDWKKPFRELKHAVANRTPSPPQKDLRPMPGMWGEETSEIWAEEEANEFQREDRAKERREHHAVEAACLDVREMLSDIVQIAERRLLGQSVPSRSGKRSREETETILREYCQKNRLFIEFLKKAIHEGDRNAEKVARQFFKHAALKKRLNLSHGAISQSPTYQKLKKDLLLNGQGGRPERVGFEIGNELVAMKSYVGPEVQELMDRIDACVDSGLLKSEQGSSLSRWLSEEDNDEVFEKVEEMVRSAERGTNPFSDWQ